MAGFHAYVVSNHLGLRVVDVSDPWAPAEIGSYPYPWLGSTYAVAVEGPSAFATNRGIGMSVLHACHLFVDGLETGTTAVWGGVVP